MSEHNKGRQSRGRIAHDLEFAKTDDVEHEFMTTPNLKAFCDESYTDRKGHSGERPFVIAGYVAPAKVWMEFEGWWNVALSHEKLKYFHMSDCENRNDLFKNMDLLERERLQRVFIDLIVGSKIAGIAVGVSQDALAAAHDELSKYRVPRLGEKQSMVTPYLFAFELCVNWMLAYIEPLAADEQVTFIFDEQNEFAGRADKVHRILLNCEGYRNRQRIGPSRYAKKTTPQTVPIQAADILAYEMMRHLRDPGSRRWQFDALLRGRGGAALRYYGREELSAFVARLHVVSAATESDSTA